MNFSASTIRGQVTLVGRHREEYAPGFMVAALDKSIENH